MERDITTFENSLEGIVSKRKHSRYRSGRSRDWLKMKNPNAPGGEAGSRKGLLKRAALVLKAITITTSSVLTESSSGAFLRPPHRLGGHSGCGRWLTGITRTERPRTDMSKHGTPLCTHSLGAGTERRDPTRSLD